MKKLIAFILVLIVSQSIFAQSGWQNTFTASTNYITTLYQKDSSNYMAFCNTGQYFLKSSNEGANWSSHRLILNSSYCILSCTFTNSQTGWIVGLKTSSAGVILKTTNGGENWQEQNPGMDFNRCNDIFFLDNNTGWISTSVNQNAGCLLKTTNGGLNWILQAQPEANIIRKVKFINSNTGWLLAQNGYIAKTTNGGENWIRKDIPNVPVFAYVFFEDISVISEDECWVLSFGHSFNSFYNMFFKTTDSGSNWDLKYTYTDNRPNESSQNFSKIKFINSVTGYAGGNMNLLLKTTNNGVNWSVMANPLDNIGDFIPMENDVVFSAGGGNYYTSYPYNSILKSTNGGTTWAQLVYNGSYPIFDVHFKDTQNGLALKDNGYVYKTTNRGIEWNVCYYNSVGYTSILYSSVNSALVIGYNGKIARTTNYGNTWNEVSSPVSTNLYKGCFVNVSTGFIVGNTKTVLKSTDTGISWNKLDSLPIGFITNPKNIEFINENTGFIIGDKIQNGYYTQIIKTTNCGLNWNLIYDNFNTTSSSHFDKIKFFNEMTGWIYYDNNIKKTTNGGLNWFIYNSPSSSFYIFTLKMINENTGWAGGTVSNRGKLYKTTNAGVSWFEQFNQANYYLKQIPYSIYSLDSNDVWFCGADDIMFHTTTGGVVTSVSPISNLIPEKYLLQQNYPNPFNPSTKINYEIKLAGFVSLKVFDLLGKEVAQLVNEKQNAGSYAVDFNSTEFNLPSGVYFYILNAGEFKETKKMVLVK